MIDFEIASFKADLLEGCVPFAKMEACLDPAAQDLSIYHEATFFPLAVVHGETVGLFSRPGQHCNAVFERSEDGKVGLRFEESTFTYILNNGGSYFFSNRPKGSSKIPCLMNAEQYKNFKLCSRSYLPSSRLYSLCRRDFADKESLVNDIEVGKRFRLVVETACQRIFSIEVYMVYVFENFIKILLPVIETLPNEVFNPGGLAEFLAPDLCDYTFDSINKNRSEWRQLLITSREVSKINIAIDLLSKQLNFAWVIGSTFGKKRLIMNCKSVKLISF